MTASARRLFGEVDWAIKLEVVLKIEPNAQLERVQLVSGATARRWAVPSASNRLPDPWHGRLP